MQHNKTTVDEILEKQREAETRNKEKEKNLRIAGQEIFNTINGKYFAKFIKEICLWDTQSIDINPEKLIYEKARRDIWLIIREFIPKNILAQIEIYDKENLNE